MRKKLMIEREIIICDFCGKRCSRKNKKAILNDETAVDFCSQKCLEFREKQMKIPTI